MVFTCPSGVPPGALLVYVRRIFSVPSASTARPHGSKVMRARVPPDGLAPNAVGSL